MGTDPKALGLAGVKIIQPIQIEFAWQYLVLAVDVMRCKVYWAWAERMNQTCLIPIFRAWSPDAVIWDGTSAHRGKAWGNYASSRYSCCHTHPNSTPVSASLNGCDPKLKVK